MLLQRGYAWEGRWNTEGSGVRGHAGIDHRTLATYLNALVVNGFVLEQFAEAIVGRAPVPHRAMPPRLTGSSAECRSLDKLYTYRLPSEYGRALVRGSTIMLLVFATFGVARGSV